MKQDRKDVPRYLTMVGPETMGVMVRGESKGWQSVMQDQMHWLKRKIELPSAVGADLRHSHDTITVTRSIGLAQFVH